MKNKNRKKLAQQLSSIMRNPETPVELYNAIGEALTSLSNYLDYNSAEVIEMSLNKFDEKERSKSRCKR